MLPIFTKRQSLWIVAAAAMAAGCASPPGGQSLHAPAQPAADVRPASPQHAARAAPSRPGVLEGVSCARPAACVAVGFSLARKPGHFRPLAEAWNGTAWRVLKVPPLPRGFFGGLDNISCPSASRCLAVGTAENGRASTGIAESWNGATWHRLRIRFPRGTVHSSLNGASCRGRTCMIVGAYQRQRSAGKALPLALQLRGTRLRLLRPRVPAGRKFAELAGVSCAPASACTAVGGYFTPSAIRGPHSRTLAETWNGTGWRVIPTPHLAPDSELGFVSCAAAARCMATGSFDFLTAASTHPLTEAGEAGRWHVLHISGPRIPGFFPFGVSCGSAGSCIAVGSTSAARADHPGAERWNGRTLRALPVPRPVSGHLNGVSCVTPRRCIAVGGTGHATLAELWNGKTWQVLPAQP